MWVKEAILSKIVPTSRMLGLSPYYYPHTIATHEDYFFMSKIEEHTEINDHLEKIAKNLIVEHLIYTVSIATNKRTPGIFPLR